MKKYLPLYIGMFVCICESTFAQLKINNASAQKVQMSLPVVHITPVSTMIKQVKVTEINKPFIVSVNNVQEWTEKIRAQCPFAKAPVPTLTLKAERTNNFKADLQWETKYAFKANGFNIERSSGDSLHFSGVNFAFANADKGFKNNYQLSDNNNYDAVSFYRIKQLNSDTGYLYSNIVAVKGYEVVYFNIYPNPVSSGKVWIEATAKLNGIATIILYDASGKIVEQQSVNCTKSVTIKKSFDAGQLASGAYQVKILMPDETFIAGKFIKE